MRRGSGMYDDILVPTDGSDGATAAIDHAIAIARRYGSTIHALYVVDTRMSPITSGMDPDEVRSLLDPDPTEAVVDRAAAADILVVDRVQIGVPHATILAYIDEHDIELVVMGTHGRSGIDRALLGSVAERVVRTADVPVLTVPMADADAGSEP